MRPRPLEPGVLRRRMVLEAAVPVPDGAGGHAQEWVPVAVLFGRIAPVGAASRAGAGQELATVTHVVTIRARTEVASGMRLAVQGRRLAVVTVHDPDGSGRTLECRVREEGR